MDVWISIHNTHMANNLVKWWRTKFLNGYKQFSVECGNSKVSDTEELLGKIEYEDENFDRLKEGNTQTSFISSPPIIPVAAPLTTPKEETPSQPKEESPPHHRLNLEEFSCDVSVGNGELKSGQQRKEFSFTLYDFDGHGKITKDDIAGLVTTIYEALGSSIKVPHYGSKTIKVKLTVSPEQRKGKTDENDKCTHHSPSESKIGYKKNINVTISSQNLKTKRRNYRKARKSKTRKHHCCKKHEVELEEKNDQSDDYSDICSRLSGIVTGNEEEEVSDNEQNTKMKRKSNPRYTVPNLFLKDLYDQQENCLKMKKVKKRSGSLQRQELLEIIQANMDKNLSFRPNRKQYTHHAISEDTPTAIKSKQQKTPEKMSHPSPFHYLANIVDPAHFYVDFAAFQNNTQLSETNCQYNKFVEAVMCASTKKPQTRQTKCRKYNRTKNDFTNIPFRYQLLDYPMINDENVPKSPKRQHKNIDGEQNKKNSKNSPQVVTGHTSSPHYLKHRNRQEDQARAMAQVVRWLEQEFSSNLTTKEKREKFQKKNCAHGRQEKRSSNSIPTTPSTGAERHEHHHVHEHIHHHYHHYGGETPIVV